MKQLLLFLGLSAVVLIACKKHQDNPPVRGVQATVVGQWKLDSVTTYFYNANGSLRPNGVNTYPGEPGWFMVFNTDKSWQEIVNQVNQIIVPEADVEGTYTFTSDSTFTLSIPKATTTDFPCKIFSLSQSAFVYSKRWVTTFNGTEPGYIDYVYHLTK